MGRDSELRALRRKLLHRDGLLSSGMTDRRLRTAVARGELIRLSPGWFTRAGDWGSLRSTDRHLLRAMSADARSRTGLVFSHHTAAAMLDLPQLRFNESTVHALLPSESTRPSSGRVRWHRHDFEEKELRHTGSLVHTDLARTLTDIARSASFEQGVVVGDAAMRKLMKQTGLSLEEQRALLWRRLTSMPIGPGVRRARNVLRFLDGAAESPLESLFRLQFARLGFELRTQVLVKNPHGSFYRMDLELVGYETFFEADGRVKYLDPQMRDGKTAEELAMEERDREAWVVGTSNYRVLRGRWEHAQSVEAAAARLRAFNITPPIDLDGQVRLHLY